MKSVQLNNRAQWQTKRTCWELPSTWAARNRACVPEKPSSYDKNGKKRRKSALKNAGDQLWGRADIGKCWVNVGRSWSVVEPLASKDSPLLWKRTQAPTDFHKRQFERQLLILCIISLIFVQSRDKRPDRPSHTTINEAWSGGRYFSEGTRWMTDNALLTSTVSKYRKAPA